MGLFTREKKLTQSEWEAEEKLNPSQPYITGGTKEDITSTKYTYAYNRAYDKIEIIRRGTDLVVDALSQINFDVKDKIVTGTSATIIKQRRVIELLNTKPNTYQDISSFRRNIWMDFLLEGNFVLYFDGQHLYQLPACDVTVVSSPITFIDSYKIGNEVYSPNEIIHVKDNSSISLYRGDSRLKSCQGTINILESMLTFQENFFDNGAVPGLVLRTDDVLSDRLKTRMLAYWTKTFNPKTGGRKPSLLDGGLQVDSIGSGNFKELDFSTSIADAESRILKAIGVPPILLDSGNNANINPNLRLFYITTILPILDRFISATESFFGYDVVAVTADVLALRPELNDEAQYFTSLVNNGLMLGAEAREKLRLEKLADPLLDKIRIPANVAGSASGVSGEEGGAPPKKD